MSARFGQVAGRSAECRMEVYSRTGNYDILMGAGWLNGSAAVLHCHQHYDKCYRRGSAADWAFPAVLFSSLLTWDASEGSIEGEGCGWRQAASLSFEIKRLLTYNDRFTYSKQSTLNKHYHDCDNCKHDRYSFKSIHRQPSFLPYVRERRNMIPGRLFVSQQGEHLWSALPHPSVAVYTRLLENLYPRGGFNFMHMQGRWKHEWVIFMADWGKQWVKNGYF